MMSKQAGSPIWSAAVSWRGCSGSRPLTSAPRTLPSRSFSAKSSRSSSSAACNIKVDRKLNLGGTLLAQQALSSGAIDLYPEYTGTALTAVLKLPPASDPAAVLARMSQPSIASGGICEWLDPLGFNNTFAMVIRGPDARAGGLETLSDAARRKQPWRLGAGYEFLRRPDGLPGLLETYHLPLDGSPKSMDLGLLYSALQQKQVDMAAASGTDGMLSVLDVKVLGDDKSYFPPYQAALVVRGQSLTAYPGMKAALDQLSGKLSDADMRKLNYQVDGKHRPVKDVARELLSSVVVKSGGNLYVDFETDVPDFACRRAHVFHRIRRQERQGSQ